MKKLLVLAALGVGYVLGARAGRERYDQMSRAFRRVKDNPQVQEQAHHIADVAKEQAPVIKDKVSDAASAAVSKVRSTSSSEEEFETQADPAIGI